MEALNRRGFAGLTVCTSLLVAACGGTTGCDMPQTAGGGPGATAAAFRTLPFLNGLVDNIAMSMDVDEDVDEVADTSTPLE
ncbi:MAG: hypothetical protein ACYSUI_19165 [Planctomycetota bacterium]|jgi:hypothetical protein